MKERNIYVTVSSTILIFAGYLFKMNGYYQEGLLEGAEGLQFTGKSILILIGVMAGANIVFNILGTIGFTIKDSVQNKDCKPGQLIEDERDKIIELKGMQVSYAVFGAGLILSLIALTMGWAAPVVIIMIIGSLVLAEIIGNIKKLFHYRRGF
ncbi:hypothetical protein [Jiulongibacter sediminis]|uniref:hypothetical protein n=1 Tax=Jiulongibacter sediminis TaxID=1605367 RepID=UPI0026F2AC56|nr:hypothetical protein [Jiulongibacter sediminis]